MKLSYSTSLVIVLILSCFHLVGQNCGHRWHGAQAQNSRSDTIDILHTDLQMDFSDLASGEFMATATIRFSPKMNGVNSLPLDLLSLDVDSVQGPDSLLNYTQVGELVEIDLGWNYLITDTLDVVIYYGGNPATDASGWGGLYINGSLAYNLGVGFDADPHPYGRSSFPCFDNFVERSTYSFHIRSNSNHRAQANGYLSSIDTLQDSDLVWNWECNGNFPSYLVGFAVGNFEVVHQNYNDNGTNIPIELAAFPNDTSNMKASFVNLPTALEGFIESFGPYQWDKVGYVLTVQGAMEHPTNVAFPRSLANGTTAGQDIMAHELAHHWWGDLVTCKTQEDMWINEGMAEYCSHLFFEYLHGRENYLQKVKKNHIHVVESAHLSDNGYRAVYGIPHEYTYGTTVYNKGASVVHSLRGYLGDSLFFHGLTELASNNAWSALDSWEFKDELELYTGVNLDDFFDDWIFSPGFIDFDFDSLSLISGGTSYIGFRQGLHHAPDYYTNIPVMLEARNDNMEVYRKPVYIDGASSGIPLFIPIIDPTCVVLDPDELLNQAGVFVNGVFSGSKTINTDGLSAEIQLDNIPDSCYVAFEHHWIEPPHQDDPNYKFGKNHYWSFKGARLAGSQISGELNYEKQGSRGFDKDLLTVNEDSILLMYRPEGNGDWTEYHHYTKDIQSSNTNGRGKMILSTVLLGQYCFANGVSNIGIDEIENKEILIHPNPTNGTFRVEGLEEGIGFELYNSLGQLVQSGTYNGRVDLNGLSEGTYVLVAKNQRIEVIKQ